MAYPNTRPPYVAGEAFRKMLYRDAAGNEEWIWNSRDGVTPFGVTSRQGLEATHVDFHRDQYLPTYQPQIGERIFVTLTPARAKERAGVWYDRMAAHPTFGREFRERHPDRPIAVAEQALSMLESFWPCSPDLVEVTAEIAATFRRDLKTPTRFA